MKGGRKRGFTLVEILIVVLIMSFGTLALLTVYTSNVRHATLSRNRLLATLLAENLLANVRDHPYGTEAPRHWGRPDKPTVESIPVVVQGRPLETSFQWWIRSIDNGSYFNHLVSNSTDRLEIGVRWREGTQDASATAEKQVLLMLEVKREPNLVVRPLVITGPDVIGGNP